MRKRGTLTRITTLVGVLAATVAVVSYFLIIRSCLPSHSFDDTDHADLDSPLQKTTIGTRQISEDNKKRHNNHNDDDDDDDDDDNDDIHLIFSTGCSASQDWQSYAFFYHAKKVQQPGHVTRIASCASPSLRRDLHRRHEEEITNVLSSDRFHLHTTRDYSYILSHQPSQPFERFYYFNKPFGIRHWMEQKLGFPNYNNNNSKKKKKAKVTNDTIIAILDADMILLKPFTRTSVQTPVALLESDSFPDASHNTTANRFLPLAQQYGYRFSWKNDIGIVNMTRIVGANSAVHNLTNDQAAQYAVGPPYLMTAQDLYEICILWTNIVAHVYNAFPDVLSEMFAYSIAAAHLKKRHRLSKMMMVSDADANGYEGWSSIEAMNPHDICRPDYLSHDTSSPSSLLNLPFVLHYCQFYAVGPHVFDKYSVYDDVMSCDAPLFSNPPLDAHWRYQFYHTTDHTQARFNTTQESIRHSFMTCQLIAAVNQAAIHYKQHHCEGAIVNYNRTPVENDQPYLQQQSVISKPIR